MIFSISIYSRSGSCLFHEKWNVANTKAITYEDPEEEKRLLFGLIFSLKEFVFKVTPSSTQVGDHHDPTPSPASEGLQRFQTNSYTCHHYETPSGLRFILMTDNHAGDLSSVLRHIYSQLYLDYVVNNPLCDVHTSKTINSQLFRDQVMELLLGCLKANYHMSSSVNLARSLISRLPLPSRCRRYFSSNGSGFIISPKGLVVTNAHVVARCNRYSKIQITFADGSKFPASIHSTDPLSDIAILQIESPDSRTWPTIKLGVSSELRPGEWVCALGSPFSLQNSVSAGIISAVARHSSELGFPQKGGEYIQTDAAINSGNSGGPLINLDGEVIGINTMKVDGSVGISFAIPIDTAVQVIDQLMKHKKVVRAYIGMQMINFNSRELREISRLFPDTHEGVIVKSVVPGSPAYKGGLLPGDVIVAFDGKCVKTTKDILTSVGYTIGRKIEVRVKRRGEAKERTLYVVTEPIPEQLFPRNG
ncbi:hypothetical protein P43SY_002942 [Pythium insidiosum]|uniref:PDZ domain-containing protein n=1 Tax=Pythium insidiosum TaxID=114742 RepID=A0AAD5LI72_PYTIN|nr:hypothetical protein P43SY_002942 [Pythium insidiosum]